MSFTFNTFEGLALRLSTVNCLYRLSDVSGMDKLYKASGDNDSKDLASVVWNMNFHGVWKMDFHGGHLPDTLIVKCSVMTATMLGRNMLISAWAITCAKIGRLQGYTKTSNSPQEQESTIVVFLWCNGSDYTLEDHMSATISRVSNMAQMA